MIRLKLREALTLDLIDQWMRPARAFRLANAGAIGVNPDQRMQQDAAHLSDLSTDLGVGLLQSFILLVSFVGVLWATVFGLRLPHQRLVAGDTGLHGLGGVPLCRHRLLAELAGRAAADPPQQRPLHARSGAALLDGARQRECRCHRALPWRSRCQATAGTRPRHGAGRDAAHLHRADQPVLGDRHLWLDHRRGADPGRVAGLFLRRYQLRRADDGGRRLQPGALVAALVHQQHRRHRRLARHADARRRLPHRAR